MPLPFVEYFGRNREIQVTSDDAKTPNTEDDAPVLLLDSDSDGTCIAKVYDPASGLDVLSIDTRASNTAGVLKMGVSAAWILLGTTAGRVGAKFMFSSTATSGDAYGMQIRMKSAAAGGGAVGLNVSASNSIAATGGLIAIQGYAQPAYAVAIAADHAVTALYGKTWPADGLDTGCRIWTLWVDNGGNTKSTGGHYMARFSNNSTADIDGLFTIYQGGTGRDGMTYLFNFEDLQGFLSASASGTFTKTHKLLVKIAGVTGPSYIEVGTIA